MKSKLNQTYPSNILWKILETENSLNDVKKIEKKNLMKKSMRKLQNSNRYRIMSGNMLFWNIVQSRKLPSTRRLWHMAGSSYFIFMLFSISMTFVRFTNDQIFATNSITVHLVIAGETLIRWSLLEIIEFKYWLAWYNIYESWDEIMMTMGTSDLLLLFVFLHLVRHFESRRNKNIKIRSLLGKNQAINKS